MRFEDVADLLPGLVDGTIRVDERTQEFIESDLRCQAELARYRKLLRTLEQLRTRYFEPSPGLLAATLTALAEEGERRVVHSIITGRRLAYAGAAIGGVAAAGAAADGGPPRKIPPPRSSRREPPSAAGRRRSGVRPKEPRNDGDPRNEAEWVPGVSCLPGPARPEGSSSIGRASVSKTDGWGFESLLPCWIAGTTPRTSYLDLHESPAPRVTPGTRTFERLRSVNNRQTKRMMAKQGSDKPQAPQRKTAPAPSRERTSPVHFLSEVRGELRKVAWPTRQEVINSTIVVLIAIVVMTSLIFGFDYASSKAVLFLYG